MLQISDFEEKTQKDWISQATIDLKGDNPMESLSWLSEENISWMPIYTSEDVQNLPLQEIQRAQKNENKKSIHLHSHLFVKDNKLESLQLANIKALDSLEKGASSLIFDIQGGVLSSSQLQRLLQGIKTAEIPVFWKTNHPSQTYQNQKVFSPHLLKGGTLEPMMSFSSSGWGLNEKTIDHLLLQTQNDTNFQVIHASSIPFADAGANAVQELAYLCTQWAELLGVLHQKGHSIQYIISKTLFEVSLSTNYFLDIAKVRALKYLLYKLHTAFDAKVDTNLITIVGKLSDYYISPYSVHTNMLRATTATMSGFIAGLDGIYIPAWEAGDANNELANRVALNTFHVIHEEALLSATNDPAEGSYFLEVLTFEIVQKVWEAFVANEEKGGFSKLYSEGIVHESLKQMHEYRIQQKSKIMVGVNKYIEEGENIFESHSNENGFLPVRSLAVSLREKLQ